MNIHRFRSAFLLLFLFLTVATLQAGTSAPLPAMEYVEITEKPGVTKKLSRLIMGTDHLGKVPDAQTREVLDEAVRLGINAFDTAPIYTDGIETRLADWLKEQNRSDLHVITKGGFPRDLGPGTYYSRLRGDAEQVGANVFEEVRKSRAKYDLPIFIYLMHRDDADFRDYERVSRPQTPVREILEGLTHPLVKKNFQMVGLSNWDDERVVESQRVAATNPDLVRPVCSSPYFSLLEMGPVTIHSGGVQVTHDDMMNPGFQKGVKLMTYSPLGGFSIVRPGWEGARQRALDLKNANNRYWGHVYDALFHEANAKRYHRALEFTRRFNEKHHTAYTLDQIMNAYVLAHPRADFLIIGPRTVEQLRRTVQSLEVARLLTPEDLDELYRNN